MLGNYRLDEHSSGDERKEEADGQPGCMKQDIIEPRQLNEGVENDRCEKELSIGDSR